FAKADAWQKSDWVARSYNLQVANNSLTYQNEFKLDNMKDVVQTTLRVDGRLYSRISRDSFPIGNHRRAGVYYQKVIYYDEFVTAQETLVAQDGENRLTDYAHLRFGESKMSGRAIYHTTIVFPGYPAQSIVIDTDNRAGMVDKMNNFVDGQQGKYLGNNLLVAAIDQDPMKALVAGKVTLKDGRVYTFDRDAQFFFQGESVKQRNGRFNPVTQRRYVGRGFGRIKEYFEVHFKEHYRNSWIANIREAGQRGIIFPLVAVVTIGFVAVWLLLPWFLYTFTKLLSLVHFNKLGAKVRPQSDNSPVNSATASTSNFVSGLSEQEVRQRIAVINRHLYLIGPFTDYLVNLYGQNQNPADLLECYYPMDHPARAEVENAAGKISDGASRIKFIEDYFVKPISYLFLAIMIDQAEKWEAEMKGNRSTDLKTLIKDNKWEDSYFVFTDRDLRRLFTFFANDKGLAGEDPVIYFGLNQHFIVNNDGFGLKRLQDKKDKSNKKAVELLIHPIRIWLKGQYKQRNLTQPTFPVKEEKIVESKALKIAVVLIGIVIFAFSVGPLAIKGAIFTSLLVSFMLYQLIQLSPFIKFHIFDWAKAIYRICKSSKHYKGGLTKEQQKIKKQFFHRYFYYLIAYSALITLASLYFGLGVIPTFGLVFTGLPIILFALRESIRSWWYLFVESAAISLEKNQKWDANKKYGDIKGKQIARVRNDAYLRDAYLNVLVRASLLDFYLITADEAKALEDLMNPENSVMPAISNPQAKEEIIKFFNKIEMVITMSGGEKEFRRLLDEMDIQELLPVVFKGTGKKRIIPSIKFLDGQSLDPLSKTKQKPTRVLKSPFRILKENFGESWLIYLNEKLLKDAAADKKEKTIKKLSDVSLSLAETIIIAAGVLSKEKKPVQDEILTGWIIYRADGYLKTLLFAEKAGEAAFKSLLSYKLGREPSEKELSDYLMFVHIHEDIDPDKGNENDVKERWGGEEPNVLIEEMAARGYVLNAYGRKVIVSTNDPEAGDGQYNYPKKESKRWVVKTDKWSIAGRFIEQFLLETNKTDAVIVNLDRDHFFFPSEYFLLPFIAQRFTKENRLGWLALRLTDRVGGVSNAAADHKVAEDTWNTRILPAESEIGAIAFYGPGIVRWNVMRRWGSYMSNIEDTTAANEAAMLGYKGEYSPWISWGRPREMLMVSIPEFQNRFGGLVMDEFLTTHFQSMLDSDQLHWTEKLTLLENADFYFNKPIIPRYNLLIFTFAFFLSFTPFAYLTAPLLFVIGQYIFAEAITAGGIRLFAADKGTWNGYWAYFWRFWSLVFTFAPLIPLHDEKVRNAFKGKAGDFTSGVKDIVYPVIPFEELYEGYKPSIKWGLALLTILLFAPAHPYAVVAQLLFYIFPFAFIFGPFLKNGCSIKDTIKHFMKFREAHYKSLEGFNKKLEEAESSKGKDKEKEIEEIEKEIKAEKVNYADNLFWSLPIINISFIRGIAQGIFASIIYLPLELFTRFVRYPVIIHKLEKFIETNAKNFTDPIKAKGTATEHLEKIKKEMFNRSIVLIRAPRNKKDKKDLKYGFFSLRQFIEALKSRDYLVGLFARKDFIVALERDLFHSDIQKENTLVISGTTKSGTSNPGQPIASSPLESCPHWHLVFPAISLAGGFILNIFNMAKELTEHYKFLRAYLYRDYSTAIRVHRDIRSTELEGNPFVVLLTVAILIVQAVFIFRTSIDLNSAAHYFIFSLFTLPFNVYSSFPILFLHKLLKNSRLKLLSKALAKIAPKNTSYIRDDRAELFERLVYLLRKSSEEKSVILKFGFDTNNFQRVVKAANLVFSWFDKAELLGFRSERLKDASWKIIEKVTSLGELEEIINAEIEGLGRKYKIEYEPVYETVPYDYCPDTGESSYEEVEVGKKEIRYALSVTFSDFQLKNINTLSRRELEELLEYVLRDAGFPVEYASNRAIPEMEKQLSSAKVSFVLESLRFAIDLVHKFNVPCCDALEVGVPLIFNISRESDIETFKINLKLLQVLEVEWYKKYEDLRLKSQEDFHREHRSALRSILPVLIEESGEAGNTQSLVEKLLSNQSKASSPIEAYLIKKIILPSSGLVGTSLSELREEILVNEQARSQAPPENKSSSPINGFDKLNIKEAKADQLTKQGNYKEAYALYAEILDALKIEESTASDAVDIQIIIGYKQSIEDKLKRIEAELIAKVMLTDQDASAETQEGAIPTEEVLIEETTPFEGPVVTREDLANLSAVALAGRVKDLNLSQHKSPAKFAIYSGPPGGGKGAVWKRFQELYGDLTNKFVLFHTRKIRPGEAQDREYYFRTPDHLKKLAAEGKIIVAYVNSQLQGIALNSFTDNYIDPETGAIATCEVKGLEDTVFTGNKLVIAEVGLSWFEKLRERYGKDLVALFISPLTPDEIEERSREPAPSIVALDIAFRIYSRQVAEAKKIANQAQEAKTNNEPAPKPYTPVDLKEFKNRVNEAAEQVRRSGEYTEILFNPWTDDPEEFNETISRLTDEFARSIFRQVAVSIGLDIPLHATADQLAETLRATRLDLKESIAKFAIYSGPPGGGKGAVWKRFQELYGDLTNKFVLFHTRKIRPGEAQDREYYFRTPDHLKKLAAEGKIIVAYVNSQLQGIALNSFTDNYIDPETGAIATCEVKGLEDTVFTGNKLVIAEVGLSWFEKLRERYGKDLVALFISPLTPDEIEERSREPAPSIVALDIAFRIYSRQVAEAKKIANQAQEAKTNNEPAPKPYTPVDLKEFKNRVNEAAEQVRRSGEYTEILFNPWTDDPEEFNETISRLTDEFAQEIFRNLLSSIADSRDPSSGAQCSSPISTEVRNILLSISEEQIANMSADELAATIDKVMKIGGGKGLAEFKGLFQKLLFFSAAPGTGKDEAMKATFKAEPSKKAPFQDLTRKQLLYHSRDYRPSKDGKQGEKDGYVYHFRKAEYIRTVLAPHGVIYAEVNRQGQGLADGAFVETGLILKNVTGAENLLAGDVVLEVDNKMAPTVVLRGKKRVKLATGAVSIPLDKKDAFVLRDNIADVKDDTVKVNRHISGLQDIFDGDKLVVLEGGYNWFKAIRDRGYNDVYAIFITPFEKEHVKVRGENTQWIDREFPGLWVERLVAYRILQQIIMEAKAEINLAEHPEFQDRIRIGVPLVAPLIKSNSWLETIEKYLELFGVTTTVRDTRIALRNAEMIEDGTFLKALNIWFADFAIGKPQILDTDLDHEEKVAQAKALAYEVGRRISNRDGEVAFKTELKEKGDEKGMERFNRVIEGTAQIMLALEIITSGQEGKHYGYNQVIANPWIYEKNKIEPAMKALAEKFARAFFIHILMAMRKRVLEAVPELNELPQDALIDAALAYKIIKNILRGRVSDKWIETMFSIRPWPNKIDITQESKSIVKLDNRLRVQRRAEEITQGYELLKYLSSNPALKDSLLFFRPYSLVSAEGKYRSVIEVLYAGRNTRSWDIFQEIDRNEKGIDVIWSFGQDRKPCGEVLEGLVPQDMERATFGGRVFTFKEAGTEEEITSNMDALMSRYRELLPQAQIFTIGENLILESVSSPIESRQELKAMYQDIWQRTTSMVKEGRAPKPQNNYQQYALSLIAGVPDFTAVTTDSLWNVSLNLSRVSVRLALIPDKLIHTTLFVFYEGQSPSFKFEDILRRASRVVREIGTFKISIQGINMGTNGSIFAQGWPADNKIFRLRKELANLYPDPSRRDRPQHINLARITNEIPPAEFAALYQEVSKLREAEFGEVTVRSMLLRENTDRFAFDEIRAKRINVEENTSSPVTLAAQTILFERKYDRQAVSGNQGLDKDNLVRLTGAALEETTEHEFMKAILSSLGVKGIKALGVSEELLAPLTRLQSGLQKTDKSALSIFSFKKPVSDEIISRLMKDFRIIGLNGGFSDLFVDLRNNQGAPLSLTVPHDQAHAYAEFHADNYIFVFNHEGDVLIQTRARNKKVAPLKREASASGRIASGKNSLEAAVELLQKELGIKVERANLSQIGQENRIRRSALWDGLDGEERVFTTVFAYILPENESISFNPKEIQKFEFVSLEKELRAIAKDNSNYADIKDVLGYPAVARELLQISSEIRSYGVASRGVIKTDEVIFRINNLLSPERVRSVAFVTPEATPFIKTGGLGDVAGEYPQAAAVLGIEMNIFTLGYDAVLQQHKPSDTGLVAYVTIAGNQVPLKISTKCYRNVNYYFLSAQGFTRAPYEGDKLHLTILLSEGALKAIEQLVAQGLITNPQVIHANDWQAGLVPVFIKTKYNHHSLLRQTATVFTVHNQKYRADWIPGTRFPELGIGAEHWYGLMQPDAKNHFSILAGALFHADKVNAVSPTNRNELLTPEYGEMLVDLFRLRADDLCGIMNGVDYEVWDPVRLEDKPLEKSLLQTNLGLTVSADIPLVGMVARIAQQKNVKRVIEVIERALIATNGRMQFVFIGKGDKNDPYSQETLEKMDKLAHDPRWVSNVRFIHAYTTEAQNKVFKGIDMFVYPSRYEPCGTKPIVALINGNPCIVRKTGGLADNVQEYNRKDSTGNGFVYTEDTNERLYQALSRALELFRDQEEWKKIVANAQAVDRSWTYPAMAYADLYRQAIDKKLGRASSPIESGKIARYAYLRDKYFSGSNAVFNTALSQWQAEYKTLLAQRITLGQLLEKEYFLVTDENGNYLKDAKGNYIIRPRDLCHKDGTWHRSILVFLVDKEGKFLRQQRLLQKDRFPGAFDLSVGGHNGLLADDS
ncbi:MAG: glycogen/starch synthase, partial [Candidatus Omnitrophica bacterium]|nr:glycogen/starch synthase [Candidatus Omnitrophota bacterium]